MCHSRGPRQTEPFLPASVHQSQQGGDTGQDDTDGYDHHTAEPDGHVPAQQLDIDLKRRDIGLGSELRYGFSDAF